MDKWWKNSIATIYQLDAAFAFAFIKCCVDRIGQSHPLAFVLIGSIYKTVDQDTEVLFVEQVSRLFDIKPRIGLFEHVFYAQGFRSVLQPGITFLQ